LESTFSDHCTAKPVPILANTHPEETWELKGAPNQRAELRCPGLYCFGGHPSSKWATSICRSRLAAKAGQTLFPTSSRSVWQACQRGKDLETRAKKGVDLDSSSHILIQLDFHGYMIRYIWVDTEDVRWLLVCMPQRMRRVFTWNFLAQTCGLLGFM
jgi:hypothetical protein